MARRNLERRRVVITGVSSGIGQQLALQLARFSCRMVINARRVSRLEKLARELESLGSQVRIESGDITDPEVRSRMVAGCVEDFGGMDILINNAGVGGIGDFASASPERLRKIMEVNFFAPAELTRKALPHLETGDQPMLVNISSVLGHRAVPLKSEYCASKFALHGWSDALRAELADKGIDVLLVSPATTDSEFFDNVIENSTGRDWKLASAKSPAAVARRTVRAIQRGNHEILISAGGRGLVWLDRIFPWLADRMVERFGK